MLDFQSAAKRLGCEPAALQAVHEVETGGRGRLLDGRPAILFEAHIFDRLTNGDFTGAVDRNGVVLSTPNWDSSLYGRSGAHQYERLEDAMKLDERAAVMACSWGPFQIMGFNFASLGFPSVDTFREFIAATDTDEENLDLFVRYILVNQLDDELRALDWKGFARGYNGPGYRQNKYDDKMAAAYAKFRGRPAASTPGQGLKRNDTRKRAVRALQEALGLPADGSFGPNTEDAVRYFQRDNGLAVDGIAGRATHEALGLRWPPPQE